MGEACRKFAVKTSPIPLFNFGKQPKTANTYIRLLKIGCFKRDHEKGSLIFSFAPQPLFIDKIMKNKKAWSQLPVSLSYKPCLQKFLFWSSLLNLETVERKGKNDKALNIS